MCRTEHMFLGEHRALAELERWLRSYRPEELFDATGAPVTDLATLPPTR